MEKIDLTDITFMIPFRCDSQDRLDNLELVIEYLTHHFDTNIMIMESSSQSILANHSCIRNNSLKTVVKYCWIHSDEETFHRTKILNDMLEDVKTKYVANYDTDVLFPVQSYVDALVALKTGKAIVFPYLGKFCEIPRSYIPEIREKMEVSWIDLNTCGVNHPNSVGGAIFFNTEEYKKLGGECEAFKNWGYEDNFRVNLFLRFGYEICRVGSELYHLEHWRGSSSGPNHPDYHNNTMHYYNMANMSREELAIFVYSYNRFKE